jgi:hypothetical protein
MIADANVKTRISRGGLILLAVVFFSLALLPAKANSLFAVEANANYDSNPEASQLQMLEFCCPT